MMTDTKVKAKDQKLQQRYRKIRRRQILVPVAIAELIVQGLAIRSILHRSSFKRGNKFVWLPVTLIQPIGPWLYFRYGRGKK
ncbi:hypothetical protein [Loigolactobacillus iwatensis]|uniref:hypothetical protein n=1 Tax=Loigolactobacillus iwatensis TaxID=1267156 RepID=UPI001CDC8E21|nr:hypothetical protein [Loigolactobacillus iwatensis]